MIEAAPEIRALTRAELAANLPAFIRVGADVPSEYWEAEHFLAERPAKWELSSAAWQDDAPVGYAIVSRRAPDQAHLHHFMVAPAARGGGLGGRLARFMIDLARERGYRRLTLKVDIDNSGAQRFYTRLRFVRGEKDGSLLWFHRDLVA